MIPKLLLDLSRPQSGPIKLQLSQVRGLNDSVMEHLFKEPNPNIYYINLNDLQLKDEQFENTISTIRRWPYNNIRVIR